VKAKRERQKRREHKLHGTVKTDGVSIKKACESASQLARDDAWAVSVV
jgi:hypothetical protein